MTNQGIGWGKTLLGLIGLFVIFPIVFGLGLQLADHLQVSFLVVYGVFAAIVFGVAGTFCAFMVKSGRWPVKSRA